MGPMLGLQLGLDVLRRTIIVLVVKSSGSKREVFIHCYSSFFPPPTLSSTKVPLRIVVKRKSTVPFP